MPPYNGDTYEIKVPRGETGIAIIKLGCNGYSFKIARNTTFM